MFDSDLSRQPIYSSEEDASDIEDRKAKKLIKTKALQDSEDEEGGAEDEEMKGSSSKGRAIPSDSGSEDSDWKHLELFKWLFLCIRFVCLVTTGTQD